MANSLDLFAYLAAFVSVILALAVGDWVQSLHRLIRARDRVRWSAIAILAALLVFLAILEEFFGLWRIAGAERFTYLDLLALVIPPIILSLAAMTVLPDEVPAEGIDLTQHYMDNRRILFLLLSLWVLGVLVRLTDLLQIMRESSVSILEAALMLPWQTVPLLLLFALLAWSRNLRVQLIGLVTALILVNGAMATRDLKAGTAVERPASAAIR